MAFIWNIISGKNLLLNEIGRITVALPIERANVPAGSVDATVLFRFALVVDAFVKAITIESKDKALASVGRSVQSAPGPIERLASFTAWLFELRIAGRAQSAVSQLTASTIAAFRKEMYPVGSVVNDAMQRFLDEEDRYVAIREGGGDDGGRLARTLLYALYDVLGVWHSRGLTVDEILSENPNYDPAKEFEQKLYITGLVTNLTDSLSVD